MSKPWLTVIMPVHCGEQWIEASLRSLAEQADPGIEILVIDSSPDSRSVDIAHSFSDRLSLSVYPNSPLKSWPSKTNHGAQLAHADHICWLHQDDLWLPGRASSARAWIAGAPQATLHLAPSAIVDRSGRTLGIWRCPFSGDGAIERDLFLERLLVQNFISAPAPVYRRDAWLACGGLDPDLWYTGDWDVWLKLGERGAVHYHDQATTAFRVHGSSLTVTGSRNAGEFEQQMQIVLDRHLPLLQRHSSAVRRASIASIKVNGALAAASGGKWSALLPAAARVLALGPVGIHRYMRDSRIVDRLIPRLRAKLMGSF